MVDCVVPVSADNPLACNLVLVWLYTQVLHICACIHKHVCTMFVTRIWLVQTFCFLVKNNTMKSHANMSSTALPGKMRLEMVIRIQDKILDYES